MRAVSPGSGPPGITFTVEPGYPLRGPWDRLGFSGKGVFCPTSESTGFVTVLGPLSSRPEAR
jgi:hypothetical protein